MSAFSKILFAFLLCSLAACGGGGQASHNADRNAAANTTSTSLLNTETNSSADPTPWQPVVTDTLQIQLTGRLNTTYDTTAYDIDLFDTSLAQIAALKTAGRRIICYFSAGSFEDWRPDAGQFTETDKGKPLDGWAGENWLDITSTNVRSIMAARIQLAKDKGCDAIDPDNVDGYTQDSGFTLSATDQIDYNRFLADQAHLLGLKVGLKNNVEQITDLHPYFDFAINEQCWQYNECQQYLLFTQSNKPVFNIEYQAKYKNDPNAFAALCQKSQTYSLRSMVMPKLLNGRYRYSCD